MLETHLHSAVSNNVEGKAARTPRPGQEVAEPWTEPWGSPAGPSSPPSLSPSSVSPRHLHGPHQRGPLTDREAGNTNAGEDRPPRGGPGTQPATGSSKPAGNFISAGGLVAQVR